MLMKRNVQCIKNYEELQEKNNDTLKKKLTTPSADKEVPNNNFYTVKMK